MRKSPELPIIIPVYNAENLLSRCLDSVLAQQFQDFEAICIDDGSTDRSAEILARYADSDVRIKILTQKNSGVYAARNTALAQARGQWIGFADADDVVDADFYQKLIAASKRDDVDIVMGGTRCFWTDGKCRARSHEAAVVCDLAQKISRLFNGALWDKIYRAQFLKNCKLGFGNSLFSEDNLFVIKSVYYARSMALVPDAFYGYFQNPKSLCHLDDPSTVVCRKQAVFSIATDILDFAGEKRFDRRQMKALFSFLANTVVTRKCFRRRHEAARLKKMFGASFVWKQRLAPLLDFFIRTTPDCAGRRVLKIMGLKVCALKP